MTISPQNPVCPLADKGFLVTDAQTLPSLINTHPTLLVLLQSDPNKHPEVADSWVIIPEILKQFPATSYTAAFADSEQSELIAREYRILKYPALLFFRQHRFVGSLAGLYSWQEYSQRVVALLTTPGYRQDIPVITQ
ncbi:hydrogenase [Salmonella enterica]|uniref:Hydrogenase n=17 Tax=Salmonella enterica TaxID=28901 RepID=A0A637CUF8_SALET|nr:MULTISPECIES: hydrogenase [Salmonella]EAA1088383.1 hydrogenase [Salmonella enterica subsp. enterica serovar Durban]EAA7724552.1 hydrogenase [Salmonella enterica subsp. enterica serovar Pomona]EAN3242713.1 hydrogenase [Salmonella enterica subsp. enterica serovar Give]EAS0611314.1 hydrogenase [Salmonella enterica subsp. enterica serovar Dahomey]EBA2370004.1 hydrogenase [Salmonella enterica subsp. enterica serovar Dublin]EBE9587753.1 hydrogenase [Salmonella enterica subsp. enterica serovar In